MSTTRKSTTAVVLAITAVSAVALAGCGSSGPSDFTLTQAKPDINQLDLGSKGSSHGDETHFEAGLTKDGKDAGTVFGTLTTKGLATENGRPASIEIRRSELVFDLEDGDVMALGVSEYPAAGWKLKAEEPTTRAIIGGTGKYAGARGELVTTRNSDGTYDQEFKFSN